MLTSLPPRDDAAEKGRKHKKWGLITAARGGGFILIGLIEGGPRRRRREPDQ
jgi:hypothetical protein